MANTLKFYSDSGLTTEQTAAVSIIQNSDGSSGPTEVQLWLGSIAGATQFQAYTNPGVDQITVTPMSTYAEWQASTAYVANSAYVRPLASKNGYLYRALSTGDTGATEPVWPTVIGDQVVDNQVTWTCQEKIHETTEIKLATTQAGLASAVAGDPLDVGITILSGTTNAVTVWVSVEDATGELSTETELYVVTNTTQETPQ